MPIPIFQVDAFARQPFEGNPAAVCPLERWLDDSLMQNIARENNLAETAFIVPEKEGYRIRWFTPECEIELCGHATIAAAYVLWHFLAETRSPLVFFSLSGELTVTREAEQIILNFPSRPIQQPLTDPALATALGNADGIVWMGAQQGRVLVELTSEQDIAGLQPDFDALLRLPYSIIYTTARGDRNDFVCRVFAPAIGINEDPVTGSAYTSLTPYWAAKLGKSTLQARQISSRGGDVSTRLDADRVFIGGYATCFMRGDIYLERY